MTAAGYRAVNGYAALIWMSSIEGLCQAAVALPVNPYTGDLILTQEAAEALDLSDYDPGIEIVPAEDGEVLIEVRELIEAMGYVAPKQKYWDKVQSDSDDE